MSTSEKYIEKKLGEAIKKRGGLSLKLLTGLMSGLPDRLCLLPKGVIFFVETKSTGDDARKLQKYIHHKIRKLGFDVYVLDNADKIQEILSNYE